MASFNLSVAAQTTDFSKKNVAKLNRRLEWQKQNLSLGLNYISIELNIIKLFAFINALFANNRVGSKGYCNYGYNRAFVRTHGKGVK
jgi:hypothetical protein